MTLALAARAAQANPPRLRVRTVELDPARLPQGAAGPDLLALLAGGNEVVSWVRQGRGLVGVGRALVLTATGAERVEDLRAAWRATVGASRSQDPLKRPGTGLVSLGAITFSPGSAQRSVLVVPQVLVGLDEEGAWATTVELGPAATGAQDLLEQVLGQAGPSPLPEPVGVSLGPGSRAEAFWLRAVAQASAALRRQEAAKVVLARDVTAWPQREAATGDLLRRLASGYPSCWTFAVDGMVGASPELLVRLHDRHLTSRVLAGTARRHGGAPAQREQEATRLEQWLKASGKNNREHELARASALQALAPLCAWVEAPERFVLTLPNVLHLASDIHGQVAGDTGALALVGALHPTAAVCGTPTARAAQMIEDLEGMDRGRYAGPVGWVDWRGEGEWCIALRSAQLDDHGAAGLSPTRPLRVFGGGGIMPDSEPDDELAETKAKMRPVLEALGAPAQDIP